MITPNEQFQKVVDTLNDVTQIGPLAQQIALHKGAQLAPIDLTVGGTAPLSFGTLKQAALGTTVILTISDGNVNFTFTLNKEAGAPNGSVAEALQKELLLNRVGDTALCRFYKSGAALTLVGRVGVTSDDTLVLFNTDRNNLFEFDPKKVRGEAVLEIRATSVPPNVRTVELTVANNAYSPSK